MSLPDKKRALVRYCEAPVLDQTTGRTIRKICFYKYATPEASAAVIASNYFNFAGTILKVGDRIEAVAAVEGEPDALNLTVTAVTGAGEVTVTVDGEAATPAA